MDRKMVVISKKWNSPRIELSVNDAEIGMAMSLEDFVAALADEAAEPLARMLAQGAGNPTFWMTKARLESALVSAIEGANARKILAEAASRVASEMKSHTARIV